MGKKGKFTTMRSVLSILKVGKKCTNLYAKRKEEN